MTTVSGLGGGAWGHQGSGAFRQIGISRFWGATIKFLYHLHERGANCGFYRVRIFLSEVIQYVSGIVKQQLGAKKHQPLAARRSSVISEEGTFEGRTEDFESKTEPPTSATMAEPGQQGNVPTGRQLGPSRLGIGKPLDLIVKLQEAAQETRIPKRKPSIIRKEESKTRLRKGPLIIDIKPEPNESRTSTTKNPPTPCKLQHSYRRHSHSPESIISPTLAPGSQNSPRPARFPVMGKRVLSQRVPVTGVGPGDAPGVAETRTTAPPGNSFRHIGTSPVTSTAPDPQIPLDFILETRLSLLSEIRLIYGTDFTSLSHLVDRIREKHRLKPEQEIVGIKVTIQGKVFDVDLQEPRDWRYVSEVIFENGSRAEMLVLTT